MNSRYFSSVNARALSVTIAGASLALAVSACGGGGTSSAVPRPGVTATPAPTQNTASVSVTVEWPPAGASTAKRRNYISASTKSVVIAVTNGATVTVDNPALSGSPKSFTTVNVGAPVGSDTFTVSDYDGLDGSGALLAKNSVVFTVVVDIVNTLTLTLNGELSSVLCVPIAPFVSGTAPAFTQVGTTGQLLLEPLDADKNIIVAPGAVPALSLAPVTAAQATITATSVADEFNTNILVTATPVPLVASGPNLEGETVKTTCNITRDEALYVANNNNNVSPQSVAIFDAAAATGATPIAILKGANAELTAVQFPAVDPQGNLYVTNEGPMPGATYGPNTGYISVYAPGSGQNGNQAPIAILPGFDRPEGIAFDTAGDLFVLSIDRIQEFAPGLAAAKAGKPSNTILNSSFSLSSCYGVSVDSGGILYAACSDEISEFAKGATGAATATEIELPLTTAMSFQSDSWLSVTTDSTGAIYVPAFNQSQDKVEGYNAGSTGATAPTFTSLGNFSQPFAVFADPNDVFYVSNFGNSSVDVFSSATTMMLGPTGDTSTLTSGISSPYGVYVR